MTDWFRIASRSLCLGTTIFVLLILFGLCSIELSARLREPLDLARLQTLSTVILDKNDTRIQMFLSKDGKWRLQARPNLIPKLYLSLLFAFEDQHFYEHAGVSPLALLRAASEILIHRKIVSGGSTLTMQTVRLLEGQRRSFYGKFLQIVAARRLEIDYSKEEILEMYLTLAPFGGNVEGIEAAAQFYFNKSAKQLTRGETALLVAVPQSPNSRRIDKGNALDSAKRVLDRAVSTGVLSTIDAEEVKIETAIAAQQARRWEAPNSARALGERLKRIDPGQVVWKTRIDGKLQEFVRNDLRAALKELPAEVNAAAIVVRRSDAAVIAYVGNARGIGAPGGYLNLASRLRSPGSALKPFVYGLAFEDGVAHPRTKFLDHPIRFGEYAPVNFDGSSVGMVTLREALARSLNTAAVAIINKVGPDKFLKRLASAGARIELPASAERPGLPVALGGLGINLEDMTQLYLALAEAPRAPALKFRRLAQGHRPNAAPFGEGAAWAVIEALAWAASPIGKVAQRARDGTRRIAFKTGTSHGRRDAWAFGLDSDHVIGIWIGRPDNGSVPSLSGATNAVPALNTIFRILPRPYLGIVDEVPSEAEYLAWSEPPHRLLHLNGDEGVAPLRIQFPVPGSELLGGPDGLTIVARASGGRKPYRWIADGKLVKFHPVHTPSIPLQLGPTSIMVVDSLGASDQAEFFVTPCNNCSGHQGDHH